MRIHDIGVATDSAIRSTVEAFQEALILHHLDGDLCKDEENIDCR